MTKQPWSVDALDESWNQVEALVHVIKIEAIQHGTQPLGIRGHSNRWAEGVGFEPTKRRQPLTAFRVPRTRPDYATPPRSRNL